jgi:hypothetical protein
MTITNSNRPLEKPRLATPPAHVGLNGFGSTHGREPERRIVRDLLARVPGDAGGVLLVEGEPGIGKSALLRDGVEDAAGRGFSLAVDAADPLRQVIPFFALRQAFGEPFTALTAADQHGAGQSSARRDTVDCGPDTSPAWWIGRLSAHLKQRAATAPVLVCLDNVQWSCPATLAALRAFPAELRLHPVVWCSPGRAPRRTRHATCSTDWQKTAPCV